MALIFSVLLLSICTWALSAADGNTTAAPAGGAGNTTSGGLGNDTVTVGHAIAPDDESVNKSIAAGKKRGGIAVIVVVDSGTPPPGVSTVPPQTAAPGGDAPAAGEFIYPDDDFAGTETTSVACIKKRPGTVPKWDWLENKANAGIFFNDYIKVTGKWNKYDCGFGRVEPFHVSSKTYLEVLTKCKVLGYDTAQPADYVTSDWYPFEVGGFLTQYISRKLDNTEGYVYPPTAIPTCKQG